VAGFVGVVCLLLSVYGLGVLPINWFGLLFLALAFVLFVLELKTHSLGMLTAAGVVSFVGGALIMFNSIDIVGYPKLSVPLVVGTGAFIALSFLGIMTVAMRARRLPVRTGREALPGRVGTARTDLNPNGTVTVMGEMWQAEVVPGEECPLPEGTRVQIISVEGLTLKVKKA
jgi:membrane-bound serine protease (ClpP class)